MRELLESGGSEMREDLQSLLAGGHVKCQVMEDLPLRDIGGDPEAIWSLLLFSGYLKPVGAKTRNRQVFHELAIPNPEVEIVYGRIIRHWLTRHIKSKYMECKRLGEGESMDGQLTGALAQIEEKHYPATLEAEGCRAVLALAIVFDGKRLQVRAAP